MALAVWTSPLFESSEAQALLRVSRQEVAVLCAVLSEGLAGKTSGLASASLSIESLHAYVLKYQTQKW